MKRRAFNAWFGRIGLSAALLLLLLPTTGRILQVQASDAGGGIAQHDARGNTGAPQAGHHAHHGNHAAPGIEDRGATPPDPRAAAAADCDYCPLLASLVAIAAPLAPLSVPAARVSPSVPATPRRAWLHLNGLGSRGPPLHG